jgi:hypothetical protein
LLEKDNIALKLLPKLKKAFPKIEFVEIDPNENFNPPQDEALYIIDTVDGIESVRVFCDLKSFSKHRLISPHDYDLLFHLKLLNKLNKLPKEIKIIGVPMTEITNNPDQLGLIFCAIAQKINKEFISTQFTTTSSQKKHFITLKY